MNSLRLGFVGEVPNTHADPARLWQTSYSQTSGLRFENLVVQDSFHERENVRRKFLSNVLFSSNQSNL